MNRRECLGLAVIPLAQALDGQPIQRARGAVIGIDGARLARQNLSRNWQNGRLWWNDPDAVVLSGDDLTTLPPARAAMLRKLLPPSGVAATFDVPRCASAS